MVQQITPLCVFVFADESAVLAGHHASDGATANDSLYVFTDESDVFGGDHSDGAKANVSLSVCVCR